MMHQLHQALKEWEGLTRSEADAIACSEWDSLRSFQARKEELKLLIDDLLSNRNHKFTSYEAELNDSSEERLLRRFAQRLLLMERANAQELTKRMGIVRTQQSELKQTGANLKRLRRAYSSDLAPGWQCVS